MLKKLFITMFFAFSLLFTFQANACIARLAMLAFEWAGTNPYTFSSSVIGTLIATLNFYDTDSTGSPVPLIITLDPKVPLIDPVSLPSDWAMPNSSGGFPSPPATTQKQSVTSFYYDGNWSDYPPANASTAWFTSTSYRCPVGYLDVWPTCNLANPSLATLPTDGHKVITRSANTFVNDKRDTDPLPVGVTFPSDNVVKYVNPTTKAETTVILNSDSTSQIKNVAPDPATNKTKITTYNLAAPNANETGARVTSASESVYDGVGDTQSSTPTTTTSYDNSSAGSSSSSGSTGSGSSTSGGSTSTGSTSSGGSTSGGSTSTGSGGSGDCVSFGCATEATLKKISDFFTGSTSNPVDKPTLEDTPSDIIKPLKDGLSSFQNYQVPAHSSQCPTWSTTVSIAGNSFPIDLSYHCTIIEEHRTLITGISIICWTIISIFIVLSA